MLRSRVFAPLLAALVGAAMLGAPSLARADFELRITDVNAVTGTTVLIIHGAGGMVSTGGQILVGEALIDASGFSKPLIGNTSTKAHMHLHVASLSSVGVVPDTVTVELTDDSFHLSAPPGGTSAIMSSTLGGTADPIGAAVLNSATQTADLNNNLFTESSPPGALTLVNAPPPLTGGFSNTVNGNFAYAGQLFSLTEYSNFTILDSSAIISYDFDSQVSVPAPSSFALIAAGAPLFLAGYRLRLRRKPAVA
jgi:hypothetical protein